MSAQQESTFDAFFDRLEKSGIQNGFVVSKDTDYMLLLNPRDAIPGVTIGINPQTIDAYTEQEQLDRLVAFAERKESYSVRVV